MDVNGPPIAWLPEGSKFQSENLGTDPILDPIGIGIQVWVKLGAYPNIHLPK